MYNDSVQWYQRAKSCTKKTCCLRIGPRANVRCASTVTLDGTLLQWSDELRYLGVHVVRSSRFNISLDKPRRSFYRSASSVYGKIEHVSLRKKFMKLRYSCLIVNVFLYCFMDVYWLLTFIDYCFRLLIACSLSKSDLSSIDFAFNRFFMKLFRTNSIETVKVSQSVFGSIYLF